MQYSQKQNWNHDNNHNRKVSRQCMKRRMNDFIAPELNTSQNPNPRTLVNAFLVAGKFCHVLHVYILFYTSM